MSSNGTLVAFCHAGNFARPIRSKLRIAVHRPESDMKLIVILLVLAAGLPALSQPVLADPAAVSARSVSTIIESAVLDESREIFVRLPRGYDRGGGRYPVVYVLDGEWNFDLVAAYLDYYAEQGLYPDLIVTGVRNVDRNRDYVPRADPYFHGTGGAEPFLEFVRDEWVQHIDERFRTDGNRVLVGHSFGGTFSLFAFFRDPRLFDAHLALSASTWVADRVIFEEAEAYFEREAAPGAFVYMAVGENDGGRTVPDGEALADRFAARAPAALEWRFEIHPRTEHFLNFAMGLHHGFQALFPSWRFDEEVADAARRGGVDAVDDWFARKHATLGFRFRPAWFDLGVASIRLARAGHGDAAAAIMRHIERYHPADPNVLSMAASVDFIAGRSDEAARKLTQAIAVAKRTGAHPNAIRIEGLEERLARIEAASKPAREPSAKDKK